MKKIYILLSLLMLFFAGCGSNPILVLDLNNSTNEEVVTPFAQFHRLTDVIAPSVDTWHNITWDFVVENETTNGFFTLTDSNNSIMINNFDGVVRVQGCIHPYNDGAKQEQTIRVRTVIGGNEARCLQASETKDRVSNGVDVIVYTGTIAVYNGSKVQIQWRTTDTDLVLMGDPVFDNPVSASVNFEKISIFE
jgi:hypothetical protein